MSYSKNYIGKGTRVQDLDIIRVSISREKLEEALQKFMVTYDTGDYLVFEVAGLKQADKYGKTHTAYVSVKEKEADAPKPKQRGSQAKQRGKKAKAEEELPF